MRASSQLSSKKIQALHHEINDLERAIRECPHAFEGHVQAIVAKYELDQNAPPPPPPEFTERGYTMYCGTYKTVGEMLCSRECVICGGIQHTSRFLSDGSPDWDKRTDNEHEWLYNLFGGGGSTD